MLQVNCIKVYADTLSTSPQRCLFQRWIWMTMSSTVERHDDHVDRPNLPTRLEFPASPGTNSGPIYDRYLKLLLAFLSCHLSRSAMPPGSLHHNDVCTARQTRECSDTAELHFSHTRAPEP